MEYGHRSKPDQDAERQEQRVFWVDGSKTPYNAGAGVVYRDDDESNRWTALGIHLHQCDMLTKCSLPVASLDAELCAISAALDIAMMSSTYQKQIVIFSDSQSALKTIRDGRHRDMAPGSLAREYATKMLARVRVLEQLGVPVLLRWVPGHARAQGNVMADAIAKYATQFEARDVVNPCGITTLTVDLFIEDSRSVHRRHVDNDSALRRDTYQNLADQPGGLAVVGYQQLLSDRKSQELP